MAERPRCVMGEMRDWSLAQPNSSGFGGWPLPEERFAEGMLAFLAQPSKADLRRRSCRACAV